MNTRHKDLGGYYVYEPTEKSLDPKNLKVNTKKANRTTLNSKSSLIFYNTGGTISSRWTENINGVDCVDIIDYDDQLYDVLNQNNFTYVARNLKLSEKYTVKDYLDLRRFLKSLVKDNEQTNNTMPRILFTHGTDCIAYFSTWVKLLSLELGFYAVIICAQRSHDKPTCELHAIIEPAIRILKSLKKPTAVCVTYEDSKKVLIHDGFEIRKIDTYKKQAFWSFNQTYYLRTEVEKTVNINSKFYDSLNIKTRESFLNKKLVIDSFLNKKRNYKDSVVLGSGIGNFLKKSQSNLYSTKTLQGPMNELLYSNDLVNSNIIESLQKKGFKKEKLDQYSYEALHLLINVLIFS